MFDLVTEVDLYHLNDDRRDDHEKEMVEVDLEMDAFHDESQKVLNSYHVNCLEVHLHDHHHHHTLAEEEDNHR